MNRQILIRQFLSFNYVNACFSDCRESKSQENLFTPYIISSHLHFPSSFSSHQVTNFCCLLLPLQFENIILFYILYNGIVFLLHKFRVKKMEQKHDFIIYFYNEIVPSGILVVKNAAEI